MTAGAIESLLELADTLGADITMFDDRIPEAENALRAWAESHGYEVEDRDATIEDVILHGKPMRVHTLRCRKACVHLMHIDATKGVH